MALCKNHKYIYFDTLRRVNKAETVLSLILASKFVKSEKENDRKKEIAKNLVSAYDLFLLNGSGTYTGKLDQFASQYTIGHELGIWINSRLELNEYALKVANNEITIKDYFDRIFLNYFQPINHVIFHPLYHTLSYLIKNKTDEISKEEIESFVTELTDSKEEKNKKVEQTNSLFNMFLGTNYFTANEDKLVFSKAISKEALINKCDTTYIEKGYDEAQKDLSDLNKYVEYLIHEKTDESLNTNLSSENLLHLPHNRIIFGAPGTGKSHKLDEESVIFTTQNNFNGNKKKKEEFYKLSKQYNSEVNSSYKLINLGYENREVFNELFTTYDTHEKLAKELDLYNDKGNLSVGSISYLHWGVQLANEHSLLQSTNTLSKSFERVTFHPNYSYAQFVGTYKPVTKIDENGKSEIVYEFTPGPFLRIYVNAKKNTTQKYLLLIEEINRANVAAVFGDVFQLLDRDSNGNSEYPVSANEDIKKYLAQNGITNPELSIPNNMYIWATMNSADQGVFPMDTAFKRRWDFEYIGIDENEGKLVYNESKKTILIPIPYGNKPDTKDILKYKLVNWNDLRKAINNKLITLKINEDKFLGPFFISLETLLSAKDKNQNFIKLFKSKVIMYLFDDVVKMKVSSFFKIKSEKYIYSEICKEFNEVGLDVFGLTETDVQITDSEKDSE